MPRLPKVSEAQKLKGDIEKTLDIIKRRKQITLDLDVHVRKNYLEKRKLTKSLPRILGVLGVIRKNYQDATQPKQNVARFKEKLKFWDLFRSGPNGNDPTEVYNFRMKYYNEKAGTTKLYGYEVACNGKGMGILDRRIYFIQENAWMVATGDIADNDIHKLIKLRLREMYNVMGQEFLEEQQKLDLKSIVNALTVMDAVDSTEGMKEVWDHLVSGMLFLEMLEITNADYATLVPFSKRRLQNTSTEKYLANRFVHFDLDPSMIIGTEQPSWSSFVDTSNKYGPSDVHPELGRSCMAKEILATYKESYDRYKEIDCESPNDKLTLEKIYKICYGEEWDGKTDIVMTVEESFPFFDKIKLSLEMYDQKNELISEGVYPMGGRTDYHSRIKPSIMRIIYHDNHVERITESKAFISSKTAGSLVVTESISPYFKMRIKSKLEGKQFQLACSPEEVLSVIKASIIGAAKEGDIYVDVIYNGNLNDLLLDHIMPNGLTPNVSLKSGATITGIYFPNLKACDKQVKITIHSPCDAEGLTDARIDQIGEYLQYVKAGEKLQHLLMNNQTLSHFNEQVSFAFDEYNVNIPYGTVTETENDEKCEMVDFCKQYASCLMSCPYLPVVSVFESFKDVDRRHEILVSRLYIVEILKDHPLYNKTFTFMYGFELLEVEKLGLHAKAWQYIDLICRPIKAVSQYIDELFTSEKFKDMDSDLKKSIPNKAVGMCGKRFNKMKDVQLFRNEDDAHMHINKHGGRKTEMGRGVYAVQKNAKQTLLNGFRPIREMVLSMGRLNMLRLYHDMKLAGFPINGFKTDAMYTTGDVESCAAIKALLMLSGKLGGARLEKDKAPPSKNILFDELMIPPTGHDVHDYHLVKRATYVADEYDIGAVCQAIGDKTFISSLAGRGKSFAAITAMVNDFGKDHVLVVCPYNSLCQRVCTKFGVKACTFHNFIGQRINGSSRPPYDLTSIRAIVFDEIMLLNHDQLTRLYYWNQENDETYTRAEGPEGVFYGPSMVRKYCMVATGDPNQLEAVDDIIKNERKMAYVQQMFQNTLTLSVNKRMESDADRALMDAAEQSLFDNDNQKLKAWIIKNFQHRIIKDLDEMKRLGIKRGLGYFHTSCDKVNQSIHSTIKDPKKGKRVLPNGLPYYVSQKLVCRKRLVIGEELLHTNYQFEISGFDDAKEEMKIKDVLTREEHLVSYALIMTCFSLPYCGTVHSCQGDSILEAYLIADFGSFGVNKNWLYTAISRAIRYGNIYFLLEDLSGMSASPSLQVIKKMVVGYISQDRRRGRLVGVVPSDFVDSDWIIEKYKKCSKCSGCGEHMTFTKNEDNKVTVNRLDNKQMHVKDNCELLCLRCNVAKK